MPNVLNNAIRYAGNRDIQIIRRRMKSKVLIGVRDRGPGIPAQQAEAVFRPFYRLETSRNKQTGGFGLTKQNTQVAANFIAYKL